MRLEFPWSLGKTTSKLVLSVKYGWMPPDSRTRWWYWISLETLSRVRSRGDLYGCKGRSCDWAFGTISFFNLCTIDPSPLDGRGWLFRVLRFPKAVIGSAIKLGRATNGTFSQGTSRFYRLIEKGFCVDLFVFSLYSYQLKLWSFQKFPLKLVQRGRIIVLVSSRNHREKKKQNNFGTH